MFGTSESFHGLRSPTARQSSSAAVEKTKRDRLAVGLPAEISRLSAFDKSAPICRASPCPNSRAQARMPALDRPKCRELPDGLKTNCDCLAPTVASRWRCESPRSSSRHRAQSSGAWCRSSVPRRNQVRPANTMRSPSGEKSNCRAMNGTRQNSLHPPRGEPATGGWPLADAYQEESAANRMPTSAAAR